MRERYDKQWHRKVAQLRDDIAQKKINWYEGIKGWKKILSIFITFDQTNKNIYNSESVSQLFVTETLQIVFARFSSKLKWHTFWLPYKNVCSVTIVKD